MGDINAQKNLHRKVVLSYMDEKNSTQKIKSKGKLGFIRYEILLMLGIIVCLSYMTMYESMVHRYSAISASPAGNLAIIHDQDTAKAYKEIGWPIVEFHHDSTQFVTMYGQDQEEIYQLMLGNILDMHEDINGLKNWWPIFNSRDNGHIDLRPDGVNMIINYKWLNFEDGTRYLLVYNTDIKIDTMLNAFSIVSYVAMILSFVMLGSIIYWRWFSLINKYKAINAQVQDIISQQVR